MGELTRERTPDVGERELELIQQAVEHMAAVDRILTDIEDLSQGSRRAAAYLGDRFNSLLEALDEALGLRTAR